MNRNDIEKQNNSDYLKALELQLGYSFRDQDLLLHALTPAGATNSAGNSPGNGDNNEILEFLGDRILGLILAEALIARYPERQVGDYARMLARLVSNPHCAQMAIRIGLDKALHLSPAMERNGERNNESILADSCEAVIAAIFQESGLEAARRVIQSLWGESLGTVTSLKGAKARLQEWSQARGLGLPSYHLIRKEGSAHAPRFTVSVSVPGYVEHIAEGDSLREAGRIAATAFIASLPTTSGIKP